FLACNYKPLHYWSPDGETVYFRSMARHFTRVVSSSQLTVSLTPYTAIDLTTFEVEPIPLDFSKRAVVVCSGGLDSTVAARSLQSEGWEVVLLPFDYGCRATGREWAAVKELGFAMGCQSVKVDVPFRSY